MENTGAVRAECERAQVAGAARFGGDADQLRSASPSKYFRLTS
jgi:hypothetical protein